MNVGHGTAWRGLSGDPLEGAAVTHFIYVDEAGISNPKQEPFAVCAGVITHADKKLIAIERHLDRLVERHIPPQYRDGFVFHALQLFNGGGKVFRRLKPDEYGPEEFPLNRRLAIAHDLAKIPGRFKLPIAVGFVERAAPYETFDLPEDASADDKARLHHMFAFLTCCMQAEHWMRREAPSEVAIVIAEDNTRSREFIKHVFSDHQKPKIANRLDAEAKKHFPFRKLKEDPLFQQKRQSSVLQVADFCAYVSKRFLMNQDDPLYSPFYAALSPQIVVFSELAS